MSSRFSDKLLLFDDRSRQYPAQIEEGCNLKEPTDSYMGILSINSIWKDDGMKAYIYIKYTAVFEAAASPSEVQLRDFSVSRLNVLKASQEISVNTPLPKI